MLKHRSFFVISPVYSVHSRRQLFYCSLSEELDDVCTDMDIMKICRLIIHESLHSVTLSATIYSNLLAQFNVF